MATKTTKRKKKTNHTEFRVRKIHNGYLLTVYDYDEYTEDKIVYCLTREEVIEQIEQLVF